MMVRRPELNWDLWLQQPETKEMIRSLQAWIDGLHTKLEKPIEGIDVGLYHAIRDQITGEIRGCRFVQRKITASKAVEQHRTEKEQENE